MVSCFDSFANGAHLVVWGGLLFPTIFSSNYRQRDPINLLIRDRHQRRSCGAFAFTFFANSFITLDCSSGFISIFILDQGSGLIIVFDQGINQISIYRLLINHYIGKPSRIIIGTSTTLLQKYIFRFFL